MFAALWAVFSPYLHELFKRQVDIVGKRSSWKRSAIGRFMRFYESLLELEHATKLVYDELFDISKEHGVIARTVVRHKLERLAQCSKNFVNSAREVNTLLSIYNDPLLITVTGLTHKKGRLWKKAEMWLDAIPTNEIAEKPTNTIEFLEIVPTQQLAERLITTLDFPKHKDAELESDLQEVRRRVLSKIGKIQIDLTNKSDTRAQLASLKATLDDMERVRQAFASFIKDSFPIEKLVLSD